MNGRPHRLDRSRSPLPFTVHVPCLSSPSSPPPVRRLGCPRRAGRHRARHADGGGGARGGHGAAARVSPCRAAGRARRGGHRATTAAMAGCWRARCTGSTCRCGSRRSPATPAPLTAQVAALARAEGVREVAPDGPWPTLGLVVDAILGTGASGAPRAPAAALLERLLDLDAPRARHRRTDRARPRHRRGARRHRAPTSPSPSADSAAATCWRATKWATWWWWTSDIRRPNPALAAVRHRRVRGGAAAGAARLRSQGRARPRRGDRRRCRDERRRATRGARGVRRRGRTGARRVAAGHDRRRSRRGARPADAGARRLSGDVGAELRALLERADAVVIGPGLGRGRGQGGVRAGVRRAREARRARCRRAGGVAGQGAGARRLGRGARASC